MRRVNTLEVAVGQSRLLPQPEEWSNSAGNVGLAAETFAFMTPDTPSD